MDADELIGTVKTVLRVSADAYDAEIQMLIDSALCDLRRVGIREEVIEEGNPLVRKAVCCYCKANFGYDNSDASFFDKAYRQTVIDLLNSKANVKAVDEDG